jgi:glycerol-3-phosphate cytidylyltransferase
MYTENLLEKIHRLKSEEKIVGFTSTAGDLLHAGHIAMLAEAKSKCDFLIVGILTDPTIDRPTIKNKPIQSVFERWMQLQAVSYVDYVIPFETERDLEDMLYVLMPTIRFVGEEYKGTEHTGHDIQGIQIYYNERKHSFSSSELRERLKNEK